ncbi:MAG: hypothetical protein R3F61_19980 [Myxococcota bacterium]
MNQGIKDMQRLQELVRLHRKGTRVREVARLLKMSPNTERHFRQKLAAAGLLEGPETELPALETLKAAVRGEGEGARPTQEISSIEAWHRTGQPISPTGLRIQPRWAPCWRWTHC